MYFTCHGIQARAFLLLQRIDEMYSLASKNTDHGCSSFQPSGHGFMADDCDEVCGVQQGE